MKKFQLRKIIRESIKELINEQGGYPWSAPGGYQGQYVLSQVNDAIAALQNMGPPNMIMGFMQDFQGNIIQPPTAVISFTHCFCLPEAIAAGVLGLGSLQANSSSAEVQCHTYPQLTEDGSGYGISILNDVGGYPGSVTNYSMVQLAADPSLGFYDTMVGPNGANAGCQAYNQSIQVPGCMFPNSCNYDPLATTGGTSLCTWGPAGPNYGPLENPHPCPPVITPLVAGCTVVQSSNYDMYADGCEVNGIIDPNDVTCCTQTQPGGGVTPTDIGPTMATQGKQLTTPTPPDPSDPGMKRMKDLAFRGKR